jgi:peroxiredoxin
MSKKQKRTHPSRQKTANAPASRSSKQPWIIGAAAIGLLSIGGLIWASVDETPLSSTTATTSQPAVAPSPSTQQKTGQPQFELKVNPQTGTTTTQAGSPLQISVNPPAAAAPTAGMPAPDFSLQDLKGRPVQLSKLKGKVVAVNFWATWCGPCRAEIPGFVKAYEKYQSKGLEIVGISMDRVGKDAVHEFVKKNGITYPVAIDMSQTPQKYGGVSGIPTTFIVDREGKVAKQHVGYMDQTMFEKMVTPLL